MNLYHYTDQNGFLSIIKNRNLWASQIQFLNDKNEYSLAFNIASRLLSERIKENPNNSLTLKRFLFSLEHVKSINYCVCSFTENGDLLSQWRGYANSSCGYSIGFDETQLKQILDKSNLYLSKCIYDLSEQENLVLRVIEDSLEKFADYDEPSPDNEILTSKSAEHFKNEISKLAPIIKDSAFSEECEWRIFGRIKFTDLSYRASKSMLIPYYIVDLNPLFHHLVKEIIIGPTPHQELARNSTSSFIVNQFPPESDEDNHSPIIPIKSSSIPFINW